MALHGGENCPSNVLSTVKENFPQLLLCVRQVGELSPLEICALEIWVVLGSKVGTVVSAAESRLGLAGIELVAELFSRSWVPNGVLSTAVPPVSDSRIGLIWPSAMLLALTPFNNPPAPDDEPLDKFDSANVVLV